MMEEKPKHTFMRLLNSKSLQASRHCRLAYERPSLILNSLTVLRRSPHGHTFERCGVHVMNYCNEVRTGTW
jgi:hypothetical protein